MLRQSLKSLGVDANSLLAQAGIDPTARAEEISIDGFVAMANIFSGQTCKVCPCTQRQSLSAAATGTGSTTLDDQWREKLSGESF
jgi:hypothetical protein